MVIHVDGDFSLATGFVGNAERIPDLDLVVYFAAHAEESAEDSVLLFSAAQVVVEDAREGQRAQHDGGDGPRRREGRRRQRERQSGHLWEKGKNRKRKNAAWAGTIMSERNLTETAFKDNFTKRNGSTFLVLVEPVFHEQVSRSVFTPPAQRLSALGHRSPKPRVSSRAAKQKPNEGLTSRIFLNSLSPPPRPLRSSPSTQTPTTTTTPLRKSQNRSNRSKLVRKSVKSLPSS